MNEMDRTGETHPHEHLTDLVDGTITAEDRAGTEAHVRDCAQCRRELELAHRARAALMALPELDIPWSVTRPVLDEARGRGHRVAGGWSERFGRVAWATGAAAAAAVIGLFIWISVAGPGDGGPTREEAGAGAPSASGDSRTDDTTGPAAPESEPHAEDAREPFIEEARDRNFDAAGIDALADQVARESGTAEGRGLYASPQPSPVDGGAPGSTEAVMTFDPLSCVLSAASVPQSAMVERVVIAQFEGTPAVIGAFLEGPRDRAPIRVTIWVAAEKDCGLLHYASRPIP